MVIRPGDAAILIDDDRHMIAIAAKFLEQHVQTLGFGHEYHRPQELAHVEAVARRTAGTGRAQQVFGEQHADDVVTSPSTTGKREWPDSMTIGMMLASVASRRMHTIWARATIRSRACSSAMVSAPSTIASASASSRPRL